MFPGAPTPPNITGGAGGDARSGDSRLTGTSSFDASNWTVATSGSRASSSAITNPFVLAGAGLLLLLIVWRITKK